MDASTRSESATRIRQQEVVAELGQQALEAADIDQLLHDASVAVAETLGADYASVLKLVPGGSDAVLEHGVGWREGALGNARVPVDSTTQAAAALTTSDPVTVTDVDADSRVSRSDLLAAHEIRGGIFVRIGSSDGPWGVLGAHTAAKREFTVDDANFVRNVANVLASAIENERVHSELEQSERRYRALVENFPDGSVGLFDEERRYTAVGGQLLDTLGLSAADRVGKRLSDIHPPAVLREIEPHFDAALRGETNSFEIDYRGRSLSAQTLPVRNGDGEVYAGMILVQDVTERREAQRELRESEAKFRMIAENLTQIVWMATADGSEWVYINPAFERVWGRPREELYRDTMAFLESVHPADRERVREGFTALSETEFDDEFRIVRPDGEVRWVHARGVQVRDADSGMARIVGVGEDVTQRVERQRQLEESERRYRTLAEHFPNGAVGIYDHDLRYTVTEGAVLGDRLPSADRLEDSRVSDIFPAHTLDDLVPLFRAAVDDGVTDSATTEFDGCHWRVWATPLRDADGDIFAGLSFTQDITEQVERQQRLEELVDELETSNERLEQFAYAASHDLQEPLRMVSSYLQLLEQRYADDLDEDAQEFIDFAVDGANRMRDMVQGLLAYSRVDTQGAAFERVDLNTVLADVREDIQMRIQETDAAVTTESLPRVVGDSGQLRQVFQNLLENAVEYSGEAPPRIHVSARRTGDQWVVSVSDEGTGVDPDDAERIFEVFESGHRPDGQSGTGIGLALCKRILERHGGDIWVDAHPGEGATFCFTLPAVPDD